jgi:hypothetical protein
MSDFEHDSKASDNRPAGLAQVDRRPYTRPVLRRHGDVRDLTLGGTTGVGDSGNPGQEQP